MSHSSPPSTSSRKRGRDDGSPDPVDWGQYMRSKQRKLNEQFRDLNAPKLSSIFEGVTIYVNGWTQPNADELKEMIHSHGGNYEYNLYSKSKVTHTIATNLPNSKIKNIGKSIVCRPAWIVDSISAEKKLPVTDYLLYGSRKKLFFEPKQVQSSENKDGLASTSSEAQGSVAKAYQPAKGEQFVSEFFTHSRLHYLSTWSNELKQFTAHMINQVQPRQPKLSAADSLRRLTQRAIVHIDLDCFFVSVSIRNKPHLRGQPVAITHAKLPNGSTDSIPKHLLDSTSDIASCSYAARNAGIHNGMVVGKAMKLCPDLILLPYDFESYREVSQKFYEILLQSSSCVEAVSCDEAFVEFTDYVADYEQASELVAELRSEIQRNVGCTVSAGIAHNMLLARMCTRVAKPDGQHYLPIDDTLRFLEVQEVKNLPGVGYSTAAKLKQMNVTTCSELHRLSLGKLQESFGPKTGKILFEFARGVDERELKTTSERKSVSVDINYGIRFKDISEAESLISNMSKELEKRAQEAVVLGGTVTLKLKIRQASAPVETWKYLGHGACDNVTRSFALLQPTRAAGELAKLAMKLLKQVAPEPSDIRGVGLQLSKLVPSSDSCKASTMDLRAFMAAESGRERQKSKQIKMEPAKPSSPKPNKLTSFFAGAVASTPRHEERAALDLPPLSQLDNSVLDALPEFLRDEILTGYANKAGKISKKEIQSVEKAPVVDDVETLLPQVGTKNIFCIQDETKFLKDFRTFVKDWILCYIEGPLDNDLQLLSDFLIRLSDKQLDITTQVLQSMRRLIFKLELSCWYPSFNTLLERVQAVVVCVFNGQLAIEFL